jgi:hypothetical protein
MQCICTQWVYIYINNIHKLIVDIIFPFVYLLVIVNLRYLCRMCLHYRYLGVHLLYLRLYNKFEIYKRICIYVTFLF